mmetsp:Transcript_5540/g.20191  ORF Transcript_5540/g.20191 Transcript_5540/m.20191 type:complete len:501 (+) Transcript_5540:129-1631(+)
MAAPQLLRVKVALQGKELKRQVAKELHLSWYAVDLASVATVAQLSAALQQHFGVETSTPLGLRIESQGATFPHALPIAGVIQADELLHVSKAHGSSAAVEEEAAQPPADPEPKKRGRDKGATEPAKKRRKSGDEAQRVTQGAKDALASDAADAPASKTPAGETKEASRSARRKQRQRAKRREEKAKAKQQEATRDQATIAHPSPIQSPLMSASTSKGPEKQQPRQAHALPEETQPQPSPPASIDVKGHNIMFSTRDVDPLTLKAASTLNVGDVIAYRVMQLVDGQPCLSDFRFGLVEARSSEGGGHDAIVLAPWGLETTCAVIAMVNEEPDWGTGVVNGYRKDGALETSTLDLVDARIYKATGSDLETTPQKTPEKLPAAVEDRRASGSLDYNELGQKEPTTARHKMKKSSRTSSANRVAAQPASGNAVETPKRQGVQTRSRARAASSSPMPTTDPPKHSQATSPAPGAYGVGGRGVRMPKGARSFGLAATLSLLRGAAQ